METIVIITNDNEKYNNLIDYLGIVFPECEIKIRSKPDVGFEEDPISSPARILPNYF